jgi:hypothetical protein
VLGSILFVCLIVAIVWRLRSRSQKNPEYLELNRKQSKEPQLRLRGRRQAQFKITYTTS